MAQRLRDFTFGGLAVLPGLLWVLNGSVEHLAGAAFFMLLAAITVSMALPPPADVPVKTGGKNHER
jgi:hypothetical protein